ncbi:hypothetical protein [Helicobacter sp. WB40]|uniref:hypothetical protein n=1 Tax=Helicobacter sp. WB40 TaxID=3004130 RepID=UPI0022EBC420|nr:hypothetical protein [Helicobacter sp. WB40]MDA3966641.1 hypothetical protein [Helicobacter sp. WB40]
MDCYEFCDEIRNLLRDEAVENEVFALFCELPFTLDFREFYLLLVAKEARSLKDILQALFSVLKEESNKKAKKAKIKNFEGSRYEEELILTSYFLDELLLKLPKWYKKAIR